MREALRHRGAILAILLVGAAVAIGTTLVLRDDPATDSSRDRPVALAEGVTRQGTESEVEVAQLQSDASSAAEQVASGDGLRVENRTGAPVALVFPDGETVWLAAGKVVVVLKPCRERLPLRAESESGELIAERDGPCRRRDAWILATE